MASERKEAKEALLRILEQKVKAGADYAAVEGVPERVKQNLSKLDVLHMALVDRALHGDLKALQEVFDRVYGKTPQNIKQTNENHNHSYVHYLQEIADSEKLDPTPLPQLVDVTAVEVTESVEVAADEDALRDLGLL